MDGKELFLNKISITLSLARALTYVTEEKAKEIGINAVVSVADSSGRTVITECMDDSFVASYDIAQNKAFTAVSLKTSTEELKKLAQPNMPLYGIQFTNDCKIVVFGGGNPLYYEDALVGGIGVSGGTEEEDAYLSAYGAEAFQKIIEEALKRR